ncbi:putative pectinesterase/pectinesterase inhibitor 19 [Nymphaea thermarum]|nr:putative pectinesterase/pectinesterase inhibitor 19 [Nymphaea thermarum]
MGSLADPAGWLPWSKGTPLSTIFCAENQNTGPGSATTERAKPTAQLKAEAINQLFIPHDKGPTFHVSRSHLHNTSISTWV